MGKPQLLSSEFAFGSLRDELRALLTLKALAKARRALAKGLEACMCFSFTPPPPETITISNSVHILKALNGAKGPVQRFRGLRALQLHFAPSPPQALSRGLEACLHS